MPATSKPKPYNPSHPERTLLYQTVAEHNETWLDLANAGQLDGQGDHHNPKPYVLKAFAKYLECGIFAHGFARVRCAGCGHDFLVAFSCKGRGVCPSRTTRRMAETAAHLSDHVFPCLPVRQWVLSVPKRLRYYMQRDGVTLSMVLRIFMRVAPATTQNGSFRIISGNWPSASTQTDPNMQACDAPTLCHTCAHAVGFPIRGSELCGHPIGGWFDP